MSPRSTTANDDMTRLFQQGLPACSFITADGFSMNGTPRWVSFILHFLTSVDLDNLDRTRSGTVTLCSRGTSLRILRKRPEPSWYR